MQWISVKKELPEEGVLVLTIDSRFVEIREYRLDYLIKYESEPGGYIWACRFQDEMYNVTHWMPLPSAPEKE